MQFRMAAAEDAFEYKYRRKQGDKVVHGGAK
jgi:hypothetical protein